MRGSTTTIRNSRVDGSSYYRRCHSFTSAFTTLKTSNESASFCIEGFPVDASKIFLLKSFIAHEMQHNIRPILECNCNVWNTTDKYLGDEINSF